MTTTRENTKSMRYFHRMIYNFLVADSTLCTLVNHTSTKPHIFAYTPEQTTVYPCVVFWDEVTVNQNRYIDEVHETTLNIAVVVKRTDQQVLNSETLYGRILCDEIAGRIQYLFQVGESRNPSLGDTLILAHSAEVQSRLTTRLEEDEDVYRTDLVVIVMWNYQS